MESENIKTLISDLRSLNVNDKSFMENEEAIILKLRGLFKNNPKSFTDNEIKEIRIINNIKELAEDIEYCKSKESINQVIADFQSLVGEIERDEMLAKRIHAYLRICSEKILLLPSETIIKGERKRFQRTYNYGTPPRCPKCNMLMLVRESSYGHFWGCIDFPSCWGKRSVNYKSG